MNTHRTNGAIGSDGQPDLEYIGGTGFSSTWTEGGNNTTTTWNSYPSGQLHQPGNHTTSTNAALQQLGTKQMLGSGGTVTYSALQSYAGISATNMSAWSASNGNCVYILDRSHNGYL